MNFKLFCVFSLFVVCMNISADNEYKDGIFILNEDWFGKNNSSINFLNPETGLFDYNIIRNNNTDEGLTLGCTAQFGAIYGDYLYVISKQDQDGGESSAVRGGRVVVAEAKTMKIAQSIPVIASENGKSVADGRSFVGVDESKGYIGTSNGIHIFDLGSFEIKGKIEGTENPLVTGDELNDNGLGPLYNNQIGMMIRSLDYVFAIQQDKGVLVINPETDKVEKIIEGCFSTMTQSMDGNIWVGKNSNLNYQKYPYGDFGASGEQWEGNQLLKIYPSTLDTEIINITMGGINQTWYAWTAGSLCASASENILYFTFNSDKWSWFTTSEMYRYDIDSGIFSKIYDSLQDERFFYGAGIRVNPLDGKLYAALYLDNNDQTYWIYQMDTYGKKLKQYEPVKRYWFPSLFIFPDTYEPAVTDFQVINLDGAAVEEIDLSEMATDKDNMNIAITKRIVSVDNEGLLSAEIKNNKLVISSMNEQLGTANITVRFNSNGKTADRNLQVNILSVDNNNTIYTENNSSIRVYSENGLLNIKGVETGCLLEVYNLHGALIYKEQLSADKVINHLSAGMYIVKTGSKTHKIILY